MEGVEALSGKTGELSKKLSTLGWESCLIVDGATEAHQAAARASRNLPLALVLPGAGINVYDILRHKHVALTASALGHIEELLGEAEEDAQGEEVAATPAN